MTAGNLDPVSLLATDVASLTDAELADYLLAVDGLRSQVQHAFRSAVGEFDARGSYADDGAVNTGSWLAARADLSGRAARAEVKTARRLRQMPVVTEAGEAGELGSNKVAVLARAARLDEPSLVAAFARDEAMLVRHAKRLTVDQTARLIRHWRMCADDTIAAADAAQLRERRGIHLSQTFGGVWELDGRLDPESGAVVADAIERVADELRRAEHATGEPAVASTPAQRRADALVELCRRARSGEDDGAGPAVPLIIATIDDDTLAGRANRAAELDTNGFVAPEAARRLACDAGVARLITDANSAPLDLGRTTRTVSPAQRRALTRRDRGCVFPGCDRPPGWCDAHHVRHWVHHGRTDLDNLVLLCRHHHHLVHEGGFGLQRQPDGRCCFTRPDGRPITIGPFAA